MANLEKLMLLSCRPTTEQAITALRRNNEDHEAFRNTANDLTMYNRMIQASIDRRQLNVRDKADCSHSNKLQGLRPYHCTYPSCSTGSKLYRSRSDWLEHEKVAHQQLWRCRDHHSFSCHSRDAFERHLMEEHRSLKEIHRKAWMDIYKPATEDLRRHCPICLTRGDELVDQTLAEHIAEHLEQFALRASACKASDVALHVLHLFDRSQSRQPPIVQDSRAYALEVDEVYEKILERNASAAVGNSNAAHLFLDGLDSRKPISAAPAWLRRSEDRDLGLTRASAGDVVPANMIIPSISDDMMIHDYLRDLSMTTDQAGQQERPSPYWQTHQQYPYPLHGEPIPPSTPLQPLSTALGLGSHGPYSYARARAKATSAAPGYFEHSNDAPRFLHGGLTDGSPTRSSDKERNPWQSFFDASLEDLTPTSMADKERNPWLARTDLLTMPNLIASVGTGRPPSPPQRRGSEHTVDSDPWSPELRRSRPPRSPSPRDVPQRRKSSTLSRQRDMAYDSQHISRYPKDLRRHQRTHHHNSDPVPMVSSKYPRHDGSVTPLKHLGWPHGSFGGFLLGSHRRPSISSNSGNRHKSSTNAAGTLQTNALAMDHQFPANVGPLEIDMGAAHHSHGSRWQNRAQESPSTARHDFISRPTRSEIPQAQSRLAGEKQPGIKIGSDSDLSKIFPSFEQRPSKFFCLGRVFLVLWSEPAGGHSTTTSGDPKIVLIHREERVFSKVRRFVVVREGKTHCHAVPIRSYGGRGVASHGAIKSDHAIIYTSSTAPPAKWDEHPRPGESGMRSIPIQVDADSSAEHLHEMSRIDLGDIMRIEHDAMVGRYGMVGKQSMPDLLRAFRAVWRVDDEIDSVEDEEEDWVLLGDADDEDDDDDGDDERRFDDDEVDDDDDGLEHGDQNDDEDGDDGREKRRGKLSHKMKTFGSC
jgi:hypothetical protein